VKGTVLYLYIKRTVKLNAVIIEGYHCYQLHKRCIQYFFSNLIPYVDEITGNHQCGFPCNKSTVGVILHSSDSGEKIGVK
jgi:hypothetical protein